jgi:superfamily I DNA and/or RNA helicase
LAGDPKQLGPTLFDEAASYYCLQTSLLERLMENPLYKRDLETRRYNPHLVTKLVRNYRAHPELLHFPSKHFYESELIPSAGKAETEDLAHLPFLPKKGIPLIFHGLRGDQRRDSDSPSWYNALEVVQVVEYVRKLLNLKCTVDDIGIITPYRKQV